MFETISGDAEFRRVRALADVDLNRYIGGRLDSDGKPRPGDLRNVSLEFSRRQPCRACRRFCDDDLSARFAVFDKEGVGGMSHCWGDGQADEPEKWVDFHKGGICHGLMLVQF
mgnify:CR=1 FL=1